MKKEGKEGRKDEMKDGGKREEGGVNLFEKAVCIVGVLLSYTNWH